jgi:hypothetical protein
VEDRTFRIPTTERQTLREFRLAVAQATGVSPTTQRLISNGRLLFGEHEPLGLAPEEFVHLAPIVQQAPGRYNNSNTENTEVRESCRVLIYTFTLYGTYPTF